jgi:thymidylate synthase ThyX
MMTITQDNTTDPRRKAALLARYSRSNLGYPELQEKYKDTPPDKILSTIDYGHTSIGALTGGITFCIDGISILLAAKLFEMMQMGDGQECSTRYISMTEEGLIDPDELGLPNRGILMGIQRHGMALYHEVYAYLEAKLQKEPEILQIPDGISEAMANRMRKNFALDRARYFLPVTLRTNVALTCTGKIWAELIKELFCYPWPEAQRVAEELARQLRELVPEFAKYLVPSAADRDAVTHHLDEATGFRKNAFRPFMVDYPPKVEVHTPLSPLRCHDVNAAMNQREVRYDKGGLSARLQQVSVTWDRMAIAEVRDLQRHRNGTRFCTWDPKGFYVPPCLTSYFGNMAKRDSLMKLLGDAAELHMKLSGYTWEYQVLAPYYLFLGSQVTYYHSQSLDRFAYMAELRTGPGAHYRYAEHMRQAVEQYKKITGTGGWILLGDASPEPI